MSGLGVFSARERRILAALGDTVMPPFSGIEGGGREETLDRLENLLNLLGPTSFKGLQAFLWGLEGLSTARYLRPFSKLSAERRTALMEWMHTSGAPTRLALRVATIPHKLAHFDDPALWERMDAAKPTERARPESQRWRSQLLTGDDLEGEDELEAEVLVIGTGAGGAVVARELAARGHAVLMLEAGSHYDRVDFTSRPRTELNRELYWEGGTLTTVGNTAIGLMVGRSVGGTTTVNSGTCFRTPGKVLRYWREHHGLHDFTEERMEPLFERVERAIGVETASWEHLGAVAEIIRDGCDALGYRHHPLDRNATDCDGQGVCCFGCPTDAKRSMNVSYVPKALESGAMCISKCQAERVLVENGRAIGADATLTLRDGRQRSIRIRAPHVVVSCGAVYSPLLLARSGIGNRWGQLGRHLSIHPAVGCSALFDRPVRGWDAIPQGYCIDEFEADRIRYEGGSLPMEFASLLVPIVGQPFMEAMAAFNNVAIFGFMISDTSRGRVRRGPGGRPWVSYFMNRRDVSRAQRGAAILGEVFFAAGAKRYYTPIAGHEIIESRGELDRLRTASIRASDVEMTAYHPLGTCRIGVDPRSSVTDQNHESYEARGLYVVDGASVPSALGVNPQITIMAMAMRFARALDRRIAREPS